MDLLAHATQAATGEESAALPADDASQAGGLVGHSTPHTQRFGGMEAPLLFRLLFDEASFSDALRAPGERRPSRCVCGSTPPGS